MSRFESRVCRFFLYFSCLVTYAQSGDASKQPNIVFILADDLGWDDVGFHGSMQIPTPNIDALAYDGIILNNYYVQPICTPSRSALMTGKHPIHTGMQTDVICESEPYGLGLNEKLLPQYFKEIGYKTHIVGKWHLGYFDEKYVPTNRGYDTHFGYYQGCGDYFDHTYSNGDRTRNKWGLDFWNNTKVVKNCYGKYSTELFAEQAEKIIAEHDDSKPLFMYLPHQAVHSGNPVTPLESPWQYLKGLGHITQEKRRKFGGMLTALDSAIGNVTRALAARNMLNNTIIAFSTDNGGPAAGFDMNMACNWPLRGVKATMWEGGMRGAGFLWSPLLQKSGYVSEHMMQIFDWVPTLLRPAGYDMASLPAEVDGMDLWHSLSTNSKSPRTEMLHNIDPGFSGKAVARYALRVGNMKIIYGHQAMSGWYPPGEHSVDAEGRPLPPELRDYESQYDPELAAFAPYQRSSIDDALRSINRGHHNPHPVVIDCGPKPANDTCDPKEKPCVFDVVKDPCEYHNLFDEPEQSDVIQHLMQRYHAYNSTMVKPRNKGIDPKGYPEFHKGVWAPWIESE